MANPLSYYPERNLIFIHVPKTAGTAINRLLEPFQTAGEKTQWRRFLNNLPVRQNPDRIFIPVHASAAWHRRALGPEIYDNAASFAVVRDPYRRLISAYEFVRQTPEHRRYERTLKLDFTAYLRSRYSRLSQLRFIGTPDRSRVMVKHIFRFETLHDDLNPFLSGLGIDAALPIGGNLKTSEKMPLDHYLTAENIEIINRACDADFRFLGYPKREATGSIAGMRHT